MTEAADIAWIDAALMGARPQAVAALLRYFRDLDAAEEAFQDASLRALQHWPKNGPPRDPAAWLIFVGRNATLDALRKRSSERSLPPEQLISSLEDAESKIVDELDASHYRDDVLRLLFICCHPELPTTQQVALALRIVCGLTVKQIARAFLVTEDAMEQRITRAKAKVADAHIPFETPGPNDRAERLNTVAAVIYLIFNEGYSATGSSVPLRAPLCEDAIRLARILLRLFPSEPEMMGLTALMLFQHSRSKARLDTNGEIVLLDDQDRTTWDRVAINEGLALLDKAARHKKPESYQIQAAIASMHARATKPSETSWKDIARLYGELEQVTPSAVITLNRAVAISKVDGAEAALKLIEPLAQRLGSYFHFHGVKGGLLMQLNRNDEARQSLDKAIALANTAAEAAHIRMHIDRLMK